MMTAVKAGPPAIALLLLPASPVPAQDGASAPSSGDIVVTGVREGTLDLKRLLAAQAVFREGQPTFAPGSSLSFRLQPKGGLVVRGMTLMLRDGEHTMPVPIDVEGGFTLPDLPRSKWELVHNRGKAQVAIRALVLSPGADVTDRPLGDLRLECQVDWELVKSNFSLFARTGFSVLGGCLSSRFAFYVSTPRPISAATVIDGLKSIPLSIGPNRTSYRGPLDDRALPNTARVKVEYK